MLSVAILESYADCPWPSVVASKKALDYEIAQFAGRVNESLVRFQFSNRQIIV